MSRRGRPRNARGTVYQHPRSQFWWVRYRDAEGNVVRESTETTDREEAERFLRDRLNARDDGELASLLSSKKVTFNEWADWFLERRSKPPYRAEKTHLWHVNALKFLRPAFGTLNLSEITSEAIEDYLGRRLRSGRRVYTKFGMQLQGKLKPNTVHREFQALRRILNLAVYKKLLNSNPCNGVEFPVRLNSSTRKPHYMTASEQERIEFLAPNYLRHAIVILVEMGLRPYRELTPIQKAQVDLDNRLVHIPDSKSPEGVADMPMTDLAYAALKAQMEETPVRAISTIR